MNSICKTETEFGIMRYFECDEPIGVALKTYGEWGNSELDLIKTLVRPGDVILQVGAHIGALTVPFAHLVGANGSVVAVENESRLFETLQVNVKEAACTNVVCESSIPFAKGENSSAPAPGYDEMGRVIPTPDKQTLLTGAYPMSFDARAATRLSNCRLIYLDCREAISKVMVSVRPILKATRAILFVRCDDTEEAAQLLLSLQREYDTYLFAAPLFNADNFRRESRNIFGVARRAFLVFLPKDGSHGLPHIHGSDGVQRISAVSELVLRHGKVPQLTDYEDPVDTQASEPLREMQKEEARRRLRELRLWDQLGKARAEIANKNAALSLRDNQLTSLNHELHAMLSSRVWRFTAPLRRLLDCFKTSNDRAR
jgi:FkbM family methyltransferase